MGKTKAVISLLAALAAGRMAYGQENKQVLDTFDYTSERNLPKIDNGKCYAGVKFRYNLLLNGTINQADNSGVHILSRWYFDYDEDGKFGKAEEEQIKRGNAIYMSETFNKMANEKIGKFLKTAAEYQALYKSLSEKKSLQEEEIKKYQAEVARLEAQLRDCGKQVGLEEKALTAELPLPEPPAEKPVIESLKGKQKAKDTYSQEKQIPVQEKQDETEVSLILNGISNFALDNFGGSAGLGIGNERARIAALVDYSLGLDKTIETYSGPLSAGRTANGTIKNTNNTSIGGGLELQLTLAPNIEFIGGVNVDYSNWIKNVVEEIKDSSGNVIKSNENSVPSGKASCGCYGGLGFGDDWKLRILAGYDSRAGFRFGLGTAVKLNSQKGK